VVSVVFRLIFGARIVASHLFDHVEHFLDLPLPLGHGLSFLNFIHAVVGIVFRIVLTDLQYVEVFLGIVVLLIC